MAVRPSIIVFSIGFEADLDVVPRLEYINTIEKKVFGQVPFLGQESSIR